MPDHFNLRDVFAHRAKSMEIIDSNAQSSSHCCAEELRCPKDIAQVCPVYGEGMTKICPRYDDVFSAFPSVILLILAIVCPQYDADLSKL